MKKYSDYTIEQLIHDDYFFQWVKHPVEESNAFWTAFLLSYPQQTEVVAEARQWINSLSSGDQFTEAEKAALWENITADTMVVPIMPVLKKRSNYRTWIAAASVLLAIAASAAWFTIYRTISIQVGVAQKRNIELPDGSTVILNSNSTLSYKGSWWKYAPREVWVQGEAFFQVKHLNSDTGNIKPGERFYVHANEVDVEVLGTTFNVYARRGSTNISLNTGKVKLHFTSGEAAVTMKPGEIVTYKEDRNTYKKMQVNPYTYSAWSASDKIILNQTTVREAIRMVEDAYNLSIETTDPALLDEKLSGELPAGNEAQMIKALENTLGVSVVKTGTNKIKIISEK